ncbi:O-antigen ligase family protein [Sphingomonas sp. Mn802worker]|uniref:O-antigen ligase family protein n=1 Tax=Sphingomonas sp. Mn802worker TaxID=629773 RepID=UPI0003746842|nr:O-antigen ligase family protein [Sphingomonas sp. Mn802worker]
MAARTRYLGSSRLRPLDCLLVAALVILASLGGSVLQPTWRGLPFAGWIVVGAAVASWRIVVDPSRFPATLLGVALAPFAVALVQLCPLPIGWLAFSDGQALAAGVRALAVPMATASISVDRLATALATVPIAVFAVTLLLFHAQPQRTRNLVLLGFALLGGLSIILELVQFLSGGRWGDFYHSAHAANAPGVFANRNHGATFLACCLAFAGAWIGRGAISLPRRQLWFTAAALPALTVVALSGSRAGLLIGTAMALATLLAISADQARTGDAARPDKGFTRIPILLALAGFGLLIVLVPLNGGTAERLTAVSGDLRWSIWSHSRNLAMLYWPWGSGIGTFAEVYAPIEPVGELAPFYINHAHSDLLELFVEAGALAFVPLVALLLFVRASLARPTAHRHERLERRVGMIVITGLFAHSCVDYPLRTPALAIVLALALGLLAPAARPANSRGHEQGDITRPARS